MCLWSSDRLRIWDNVNAPLDPPSREVIHSHDFSRYLTPFKAVWDPKVWACGWCKGAWRALYSTVSCSALLLAGLHPLSSTQDYNERVLLCGRYISEEFNGVALHPIDILDATDASGGGASVVTQLFDPELTTICAVNTFHPSENLVVSGSSRCRFVWA